MKKYLLSLMLLVGAGSMALPALATPLVTENSTYSVYVTGSAETTPEVYGTKIFNGAPGFIPYGDQREATVVETQGLENEKNHINVKVDLGGTLFSSNDETGYFSIGIDGDGFDFANLVALDNASITLLDSSGVVVATLSDLQKQIDQARPWDGLFPSVNGVFAITNFDALRVASISVDFLVSDYKANEVPEPGSVLLCGIGLLAAIGATRRRRRA